MGQILHGNIRPAPAMLVKVEKPLISSWVGQLSVK